MVIIVQCSDTAGLVAGITGMLAPYRLNIIALDEYVDKAEGRFYLRLDAEVTIPTPVDEPALQQQLLQLLPAGALVTINPAPQKSIVVMVTKEYHCLADILVRHHFGTLGAQVLCVIGNHATLQDICRRFDVPFIRVSHEGCTREMFEQQLADAIALYQPDYIVLAKFMRILSPGFVARFPMRLINIHHSFLPAFVGASPYRQAYERGVKLIGATAHFVTNDLDEGPIIVQHTIPVNHNFTTTDMVKAGKEVETAALARALQLVFDDRVFVHKNKTIVFE